jgi:nucleoid-associated protein YgaU
MERTTCSIPFALIAIGFVGCGEPSVKPETAPKQAPGAAAAASQPSAPGPAPSGTASTKPATAASHTQPAGPPERAFTGDAELLPKESYVGEAPDRPRVHIVQPGETLFGLAQRYYNDGRRWRRIYEANRERIPDPNKIRVGTKLIVP